MATRVHIIVLLSMHYSKLSSAVLTTLAVNTPYLQILNFILLLRPHFTYNETRCNKNHRVQFTPSGAVKTCKVAPKQEQKGGDGSSQNPRRCNFIRSGLRYLICNFALHYIH